MRLAGWVLFCGAVIGAAGAQAQSDALEYEITLDVVHQEYDGTFSWFHPRSAAIPQAEGPPEVVITLQKWFSSASDFFSGLSVLSSPDGGKTWGGPDEQPALAWRQEDEKTTVGVCDFTPGWHAKTGKLLAVGHTVRYQNDKLMKDPRPRETGYAVYDPESKAWSPWRILDMGDRETYFSAGSGCAQRVTLPDGTILVPFYFKAKSDSWNAVLSSAVLRCAFDGETLTILEQGNTLTTETPRGLYEPSITYFGGRFYLTLRNDETGHVAVSDDGLHYGEPKPWTFDDGENLGSHNTQQHWAAHSEGLYLVYTRRGASNDHIPRNRAPLFIAQVNPETLQVMRATERVAVPERGAMLGNFGVAAITEDETWITVGEGMYKNAADYGANGSVFAARIRWNKPNQNLDWLR